MSRRRFQAYDLAEVERRAARRDRIEAALFPFLLLAILVVLCVEWYTAHPVVPV